MNDPIAIAAEGAARFARRLGMQPAAAMFRIARIRRTRHHGLHLVHRIARRLTFGSAALNYRGVRVAIGRLHIGEPMMADVTAASGSATGVTVTERAAQKIGEILRREPAGTMLRISVEGGGCSGFQYRFDTERERAPDDVAIEKSGATVLIDPMSLSYMAGSEIDFVDDLIGSSFKVNNPKATASCGCGTSFAL
jgi:iron-sulfur cluster assembly accessory protein